MDKKDWINYTLIFLGYILALLGVYWQISHSEKNRKDEIKKDEINESLGAINYFIYGFKKIIEDIEKIEYQVNACACFNTAFFIEKRFQNLILPQYHLENFLKMYNKLLKKPYSIDLIKIIDFINFLEHIYYENFHFHNNKKNMFEKIMKINNENINEKKDEITSILLKILSEEQDHSLKNIKNINENLELLYISINEESIFKSVVDDCYKTYVYNSELCSLMEKKEIKKIENLYTFKQKVVALIKVLETDKKNIINN